MADYLQTQHPAIAQQKYELCAVSAFLKKAPKGHVSRFRRDCMGRGPLIIWDPESDADGLMICGETIAQLNAEFLAHLGDDI